MSPAGQVHATDPGRGPVADLAAQADTLPLVDHHVHGALAREVDRAVFEGYLTEARSAPADGSALDSQLGFALRRWCSPILGLPVHASAQEYWEQRQSLSEAEVNKRMLGASGIALFLMDTGYLGNALLRPTDHALAAAAGAHEVVRLETVAEQLLMSSGSAEVFLREYAAVLAEATRDAVATKSVLAYRCGFDSSGPRPDRHEVLRAAGDVLRQGGANPRIDDPVLARHLLWAAVDRALPLQLHSGFGDADLDLHRCDPLLLSGWLREVEPTGVPVVLLHNYPYHRQAGYLAHVFTNVYLDVGLGVSYLGAQSRQLIAESLELAPFGKLLFSTDACGPSELHFLGARLWKQGMAEVLGGWIGDGAWSERDAHRVLALVGHLNAERLYGVANS